MGYNLFTSHKPCLLFVTKGVCVYKLGYYAAVNTHSKLGVCITIVVENFLPSRLTVVSREAMKKQHARASSGLRDHYSELFTRMAALKF